VRVVYSDAYAIDIGPHVWPTAKYGLVRQRLLDAPVSRRLQFQQPAAATWAQLALVHTSEYLEKLRHLTLADEEVARLEVPWNDRIRDGFLVMVGGTIDTARAALRGAVAVHLGGGLHHAFPGHGEGFCPLNDVAVAVRVLQHEQAIRRAAIVDVDVHQGNGTAVVFQGDERVLTLSLHQEHNYPAWKPASTLDIGLRDRTTDGEYLERLREGLDAVLDFRPDLLLYLAGADPYREDQLGGLALSKDGLRRRDRAVFGAARAAEIPIAVVLAGGYARAVEDTVEIHVATVEEALIAAG
jgi:acetoin utilization deacetylase AcuC-like enzyme